MRSKFGSQKHRRSIRLPNYDYAQPGAYFVTIVTYQRALLFGEIVKAEIQLNNFGKIVDECWCAIPEHFPNVELGVSVIMPNHVQGIIVILRNNLENLLLVPFPRLCTHLNPLLPAELDGN